MNWGHKITIVLLLFVALMATMVVKSINQKDISLVTDQYYDDEINFDQKMIKIKNAQNLREKLGVSVSNNETLLIDLSHKSAKVQGKIVFFRPSNNHLDFSIPLLTDIEGKQKIELRSTPKGLWVVKIEWINNGLDYYTEQKINL